MASIVTPKTKKSSKDWRVLEYVMPIKEAVSSGKDFMIRGTAINETVTRNGVTYNATELESAAPTFRNKPIMVDHSGSVKDIVGRTTENVNFSGINKSIEFEGRIMDKTMKEMINDGRITDVSIGAKVDDLVKNEKDGSITAVGLEGLEISLVAIPGDPGANLANALSESFELKENSEEEEKKESDTELNDMKEDKNMEEAEKKEIEQPEEEVEEESVAKETVKTVVEAADMTETNKAIAALTETVTALTKKVAENENPAPVDKTDEQISDTQVEDETKGEVGEVEEEPKETEEGFVVEAADVGQGAQIYRDYSKESGKFNRLCR